MYTACASLYFTNKKTVKYETDTITYKLTQLWNFCM